MQDQGPAVVRRRRSAKYVQQVTEEPQAQEAASAASESLQTGAQAPVQQTSGPQVPVQQPSGAYRVQQTSGPQVPVQQPSGAYRVQQSSGAQVPVQQPSGAYRVQQTSGPQVPVQQQSGAYRVQQTSGAQVPVQLMSGAYRVQQTSGAQVPVQQPSGPYRVQQTSGPQAPVQQPSGPYRVQQLSGAQVPVQQPSGPYRVQQPSGTQMYPQQQMGGAYQMQGQVPPQQWQGATPYQAPMAGNQTFQGQSSMNPQPMQGTYMGYGAPAPTSQQQGYHPGYPQGQGVQRNGAQESVQRNHQEAKPEASGKPFQGYFPQSNRSSGGQGDRKPDRAPGKGLPVWMKVLSAVGALAMVAVVVMVISNNVQRNRRAQAIEMAVAPYDDRYVEGVYVDGISLGGMTRDQAYQAVNNNAVLRSNAWSVSLTYQGQLVRSISSSDLSMKVDIQETMAAAWQQGHVGTMEERKAEMDRIAIERYEAYTANPSGDTSQLDSILQEIANQVYRAPSDATIASFDPNLTYPFTFNEEVVGRSLNIEPVKEEIYHHLSTMETGDIELEVTMTQPNVTVEDLKTNTVALRGSAETPIASFSTDNRNENIRLAFSKISGIILQPGAQFSFNNVVGQRTEKNGFLPAIEYAYGDHVEGIGGGVCQASTTVYLAAVRSGMEILKREPHSDSVSYIDYGKDATVYWYSNHKIDMVFKNTSSSPIYITAAVQSARTKKSNLTCVVRMYGAGMDGISYDIETVETPIDPPSEPEYIKDKKAEYVTYTDQQKTVSKAQPGCVVESYLVTYQNGVPVDRKYMYTDTYKAKAERIYVGVTSR
ncbi:MAG: VanW family protein [Clostridia bacterium]|nr:VanW family protein [Clostridia bacterium]